MSGSLFKHLKVPEIDKDASGEVIEDFKGLIQFKKVSFYYPTRPGVKVIHEMHNFHRSIIGILNIAYAVKIHSTFKGPRYNRIQDFASQRRNHKHFK